MSLLTLAGTPRGVREQIRTGQWRGVTSGVAPGYVQANLAILPRDLAFDFLLFCQRNPKPCPLLEVVDAGNSEAVATAPGSDLRTEVPGYRIYRDGELAAEVESLVDHWQDDLVSFLLGCSFSFETAMVEAGIPLRHQEMGRNVAMYRTNLPTNPAGVFSGPMVVSMRPVRRDKIVRAVQVTSRFPSTTARRCISATPRPLVSKTCPSPITETRLTCFRGKSRSFGPAESPPRPSL